MASVDSIHVTVRVRPLIQKELSKAQEIALKTTSTTVEHIDEAGNAVGSSFVYDQVFGQEDETQRLYSSVVKPIVCSCMDGYHGTIFAYGQTSSGKTYTVMGEHDQPGLVQMAVNEVFSTIELTPHREYLLRVSVIELYNEQLVDLLSSDPQRPHKLRETGGSVFVENLTEELVSQPNHVTSFLKKALGRRHVGATNMNEKSSRSHTIFRMIIESRARQAVIEDGHDGTDDGAVNVSHLHFVDLAGSERVAQTGATGERLKEGQSINKSLFTLTHVIFQLSEGKSHVNFRDSKLTRLLQNALGGNSNTAVICNVSPAAENLEQSLSTLRFASSAKCVKTAPVINECLTDEAMLRRLRREIADLKKKMEQTNIEAMEIENAELSKQLVEMQARMEQQHRDKLSLVNRMLVTSTGGIPAPDLRAKRRETWHFGPCGDALTPDLNFSTARRPLEATPLFHLLEPSSQDELPTSMLSTSILRAEDDQIDLDSIPDGPSSFTLMGPPSAIPLDRSSTSSSANQRRKRSRVYRPSIACIDEDDEDSKRRSNASFNTTITGTSRRSTSYDILMSSRLLDQTLPSTPFVDRPASYDNASQTDETDCRDSSAQTETFSQIVNESVQTSLTLTDFEFGADDTVTTEQRNLSLAQENVYLKETVSMLRNRQLDMRKRLELSEKRYEELREFGRLEEKTMQESADNSFYSPFQMEMLDKAHELEDQISDLNAKLEISKAEAAAANDCLLTMELKCADAEAKASDLKSRCEQLSKQVFQENGNVIDELTKEIEDYKSKLNKSEEMVASLSASAETEEANRMKITEKLNSELEKSRANETSLQKQLVELKEEIELLQKEENHTAELERLTEMNGRLKADKYHLLDQLIAIATVDEYDGLWRLNCEADLLTELWLGQELNDAHDDDDRTTPDNLEKSLLLSFVTTPTTALSNQCTEKGPDVDTESVADDLFFDAEEPLLMDFITPKPALPLSQADLLDRTVQNADVTAREIGVISPEIDYETAENLMDRLEFVEDHNAELEDLIEHLKERHTETEQKFAKTVEDMAVQINNLQGSLAAVQDENVRLTNDIDILRIELCTHLSNAVGYIRKTEGRLIEVVADRDEIADCNAQLVNQLEQTTETLNVSMLCSSEKIDVFGSKLKEKLTQLSNRVNQLDTSMRALVSNYKLINEENESNEKHLLFLNSEISSKDALLDSVNSQLLNAKDLNSELINQRNNLLVENKKLSKEMCHKQDLDDINDQLNEFASCFGDQIEATSDTFKSRLEPVLQKIIYLQEHLLFIRSMHVETLHKHEMEIAKYKDDFNRLEDVILSNDRRGVELSDMSVSMSAVCLEESAASVEDDKTTLHHIPAHYQNPITDTIAGCCCTNQCHNCSLSTCNYLQSALSLNDIINCVENKIESEPKAVLESDDVQFACLEAVSSIVRRVTVNNSTNAQGDCAPANELASRDTHDIENETFNQLDDSSFVRSNACSAVLKDIVSKTTLSSDMEDMLCLIDNLESDVSKFAEERQYYMEKINSLQKEMFTNKSATTDIGKDRENIDYVINGIIEDMVSYVVQSTESGHPQNDLLTTQKHCTQCIHYESEINRLNEVVSRLEVELNHSAAERITMGRMVDLSDSEPSMKSICNEYQSRIDALDLEISNSKNEINDLLQIKINIEAKVSALTDEVSSLADQLRERDYNIESISSRLLEKEQNVAQELNQLHELQSICQTQMQTIETNFDRISELSATIAEKDEELNKLQSLCERQAETIENNRQLSASIVERDEELSNLRTVCQTQSESIENNLERLAELSALITQKDDELNKLQTVCQAQADTIEINLQHIADLSASVTEKTDEIGKLHSLSQTQAETIENNFERLAELSTLIDGKDDELNKLHTICKTHVENIEQNSERLAELSTSVVEKDTELSKLHTICQAYVETIENNVDRLTNISVLVDEKEGKLNNLQSLFQTQNETIEKNLKHCAELSASVLEKDDELDKLRSVCRAQTEAIEKNLERLAELSSSDTVKDNELTKYSCLVESLRSGLDAAKQLNVDYETQLTTSRVEISERKNMADGRMLQPKVTDNYQILNEDLINLSTEVEVLQNLPSDEAVDSKCVEQRSVEFIADIADESSDTKNGRFFELEKEIAIRDSRIADQQSEMDELREALCRLDEIREDKRNSDAIVMQLESKIGLLSDELMAKQKSLCELETQLTALQTDKDELNHMLSDKEVEVGELQEALSCLDDVLLSKKTLQEELAAKEQELNSRNETIHSLEAKTNDHVSDPEVSELKQEIDELKEALSCLDDIVQSKEEMEKRLIAFESTHEHELEAFRSTISQLETDLLLSSKKCEELDQLVGDSNIQLDEKQLELDNATLRLHEMEETRVLIIAERDTANNELSDLQHEYDELKTQLKISQENLEMMLENEGRQNSEKDLAIENLGKELDVAYIELELCKREVQEAHNKLAEFDAKFAETKQNFDSQTCSLHEEVAQLKKELEIANDGKSRYTEVEALLTEKANLLKGRDEKIATLTKELTEQAASHEKRVEDYRARIRAASRDVANLVHQNKKLTRQLNTTTLIDGAQGINSETPPDELRRIIGCLRLKISLLQEEVTSKDSEIKQLKEKMVHVSAKLEFLETSEQEAAKVKEELKLINEKLAKKQLELDKTAKDLGESESRISMLEHDRAQQEMEYARIVKCCEAADADYAKEKRLHKDTALKLKNTQASLEEKEKQLVAQNRESSSAKSKAAYLKHRTTDGSQTVVLPDKLFTSRGGIVDAYIVEAQATKIKQLERQVHELSRRKATVTEQGQEKVPSDKPTVISDDERHSGSENSTTEDSFVPLKPIIAKRRQTEKSRKPIPLNKDKSNILSDNEEEDEAGECKQQ